MPILLPITCAFSTFCISSPSSKFWYPQLDDQGAREWTKPLSFPPTTWCSFFPTMASSPTSSWGRSFWWDNNRFMPLKENLRKRKWTRKMKSMGGVSNEITVHSHVCRTTLAAPLNPSTLHRVRTTNQYWPHYRLWNICSFCMAQQSTPHESLLILQQISFPCLIGYQLAWVRGSRELHCCNSSLGLESKEHDISWKIWHLNTSNFISCPILQRHLWRVSLI